MWRNCRHGKTVILLKRSKKSLKSTMHWNMSFLLTWSCSIGYGKKTSLKARKPLRFSLLLLRNLSICIAGMYIMLNIAFSGAQHSLNPIAFLCADSYRKNGWIQERKSPGNTGRISKADIDNCSGACKWACKEERDDPTTSCIESLSHHQYVRLS